MVGKRKKSLDSELDLVAFISLLSVCICFLLLTVVWVHVGAMKVHQAVGGQPSQDKDRLPILVADLKENGTLELRLQNAAQLKKYQKVKIPANEGKANFSELAKVLQGLKADLPSINTATLNPQAEAYYENIMDVMDFMKQQGFNNLGIAPL